MKTITTLTAATALLVGPVLALALLASTLATPQNPTIGVYGCGNVPGPTLDGGSLTAEQLRRAAVIYEVALENRLGAQAAMVGIATALQESNLGADPRAAIPNSDGDVGLFQQRALPGWYADGPTIEANTTTLLDDHYAATAFFLGHDTLTGWHIPGLTDIPGWQQLPLTHAAQRVQRSAHPNAYAKHEPTARTIVTQLTSHTTNCTSDGGFDCPATPPGIGREHGQTPDAIRVMRCVAHLWPLIRTIGGLRPGDPRDHGTGRAADIMIPNWNTPTGRALGQQVAEWARTNARRLGITYVIWKQHIWSTARDHEGWRPCSQGSCYTGPDPTASHRDHVHISVHGNTGHPHSRVVLPVDRGSYRITARFGHSGDLWRAAHTGLDFAAPTGTPIHAVTDGQVTYAGNSGGAYGNLTKIRATDGTETWYAHQQHINVTTSQQVTAGQTIGTIGSTGNSNGPHLHLEIRTNGKPIDPLTWLHSHGIEP